MSKMIAEDKKLDEMYERVHEFVHSVNDRYIKFVGNMFQAGTYYYPEKNKRIYYSPKDIKKLTERDVRQGYLTLDHKTDNLIINLTEGVGFWNIIGYDPISQQDITEFYIREHLFDDLIRLGYIQKDEKGRFFIKVSPRFHQALDKDGTKMIFVKDVALVPRSMMPRSEISGLKTIAIMQGG